MAVAAALSLLGAITALAITGPAVTAGGRDSRDSREPAPEAIAGVPHSSPAGVER